MRLTLKAINEELEKLGYSARLEKGDRYFYFSGGDAANWLDRMVTVPSLSSLTLDQWVGEFERLKKLNQEVLSGRVPGAKPSGRKPKQR